MKQFKCLYEELDDQTRTYLDEVRTRKGTRTPGIFIGRGNSWPVVAIIIGPIILIFVLLQAFLSTKDAWAVAMFQTAGVMLGGWLVVYAFRRWFASGKKYGGFFTYFDPTHVYQVAGESVTVTDVSDFESVDVVHSHSNGSYGGSRVNFELNGRRLAVPVTGEAKADLIEEYYRSVVKLEEHGERKWRDLPAAEMGGVAKYVATKEEMPYDASDIRLEVTETPEKPEREHRAGPALLRYAVILGIGALVYLAFWKMNDPVRDARAFARAADAGAPGLRGYLLDDRNTRHRDDALAQLSKLYDVPLGKIEAGVKDPPTKQGLTAILTSLRQPPPPVVSIDVREQNTPQGEEPGIAGRENQLRTDLADAIALHLGPELVGFVKAPENQPAHFELVYKFVPFGSDFRGAMYKVSWQLRLRASPDDAPVESAMHTTPKAFSVLELGTLATELKTIIFSDVFGQAPPVVPMIPIGGGGDF